MRGGGGGVAADAAPGGQTRAATGDMHTDKLFTGQQKEAEAGEGLLLYNYGARFYSALTGRFLSPDPVVQQPYDPQAMNAYAYVRNNPLLYTDPTGLCFTWMGETFDCSAEDVQAWFETALTADNWIGDVARWGIEQQEYWESYYFYGDSFLLSELLLTFVSTVDEDPRSWDIMPDIGWAVFARDLGVSPLWLEVSLLGLMYGPGWMAGISDDEFIGADWWWKDRPGSPMSNAGAALELLEYFTYEEEMTVAFAQRTLDVAASMGAIVNSQPLPWSQGQRDILTDGYDPPVFTDWERVWDETYGGFWPWMAKCLAGYCRGGLPSSPGY